jgi:uncharacterized protein (DUF488 family)
MQIFTMLRAVTLSQARTHNYAGLMSIFSVAPPTLSASTVFTLGHSTHAISDLLALLARHEISAIADVRSSPYSRMSPQYNRESFKATLNEVGIAYVFLGDELGARSRDPRCYEQGKVQYDRLARTEAFQRGLQRVRHGAARYRLALMCVEKEPLDCHRTILVARHLDVLGIDVQHIVVSCVQDSALESHRNAIVRLKQRLKLTEDLFASAAELTAAAYAMQGGTMAYERAPQLRVRSGQSSQSGESDELDESS